MSRSILLTVVSALAISLAVSACGESEAEEPLTKAAFIAQANTICKAERRQYIAEAQTLYAEAQRSGESLDKFSVDAVGSFVVPRLQAQTNKVRALEPPPGDKEEIEAILGGVEEVLAEAKAKPKLYLQRLGNFERPFKAVHRLAKAYGIPACART